ncbi:MAG TPA: phosphatidate cytidylyltransferase [Thermoanaerobaculia bacterium]|nr:phosphatidate cytidylyltransferase [Thermoanaerobaculia bacterium]
MQRLLTALIGTPLALAALFLLPSPWFLAFLALCVEVAVWEYLGIVRSRAPRAPLWALLVLVPAAAVAFSASMIEQSGAFVAEEHLLTAAVVLSVGVGSLVLLCRTPLEEVLPALGILCFGVPYFAAPVAAMHHLQRADPWLIFLLLAIVWLGDTGAYYVGRRLGRHKMAPVVSPNKTWEGAVAGFAVSVVAAAVWSACRLGRLDLGLLGVAALTALAAQVGDLMESLIKRGAGVKDSGHVLPGHGGVLDRMDAMLFAAPVMLLGFWLLQIDGLTVPR